MKIKSGIVLLVIIMIMNSCQKEITIDLPAEHTRVVFIEGMLFPGLRPQIYISISKPFFSKEVTPQEVFARKAIVKISDGISIDTLKEDSTFNKFRCRWEPFYGGSILPVHGKTYSLEATVEGKKYTASTTLNQKKVNIKSIKYTPEFFDLYGGHDGLIINLIDPAVRGDFYRFQMNRMIDASVKHAHVLDEFINTCTQPDELFPVRDIGRVVFSDENSDGLEMEMLVEVTYEYSAGDTGWVFIQSIDRNSAEFYKDLDDQLQAIQNPFVEPVFIHSKIEGAMGVFGSAVLSDSVLFIYPQDNP
jgi:Domain of unknown function (DUF4249)